MRFYGFAFSLRGPSSQRLSTQAITHSHTTTDDPLSTLLTSSLAI